MRRNTVDKKRQELIEWLDKLEKYAGDTELSTRIRDRIGECRNLASNADTDEGKLRTEIEELLNSIGKKEPAESVVASDAGKTETSENIEKQLKKMAQNCQRENESFVEGMSERKNLILQKYSNQINEITYTDSNTVRIQSEAEYLQFYETIAWGYEKDVALLISEMFEGLKNNYSHMLDHMKSMLRSVGAFRSGAMEAKVFAELDEQKENVGRSIQAEMENKGAGKEQILSFAKKTGKTVKKIVKKEEIKRKLLTVFPWLLLLFVIGGNVIGGLISGQSQETTEKTFLERANILNDFLDLLEKTPLLGKLLLSSTFLAVAVLLLVVVVYVIYLKMIKKHCERSMCTKSAAYLKKELIGFTQNGCLQHALDEELKDAVEKFETEYLQILNRAFVNPQQEAGRVENERWSEIVEEWKNIR